MDQLLQKLKTGNLEIIEVPLPALKRGNILVKNHYTVVSGGTETGTVKAARKGYIGKAKERPDQFKQVVNSLKTQGPVQTYRAVMKKLDAYSPLGYSCAGEAIEVSSDVQGINVGDLVACGGLSACHAEVVSVPKQLCVKLRPDADLKQSAYNTLGAIAMQGVRQADLRIGETCAVIGLGLIGQLTSLLLRTAGIRVVGIDINQNMVDIAKRHCVELALCRSDIGIEDKIAKFTDGLGCDSVIIAAASKTLDPINFAGAISRKRGTIVVVGAVPTGFDRDPHYYKKELQVRMSCSYGPGRYDPSYEEKGVDYPHSYVRWTENRNMMAFQELIHSGKINLNYLTTHTFKLKDAPVAYGMMMAKAETFIGILIEYDTTKKLKRDKFIISPQPATRHPQTVGIGFIGAGSYAQSNLLPNIYKSKWVSLEGVMTSTGHSARSVAERFCFEFGTTEAQDIFKNDRINTVFIATRHDSHANYVLEAIKAGKHVFVEKPLCLSEEELGQIVELLNSKLREEESGLASASPASNHLASQPINQSTNQPILMVGYNRRFSPLSKKIKNKFGSGPMAMIYRVNAGNIPIDSWIQDPDIGGGRIIGEVCHFIDYLIYINGSLPLSVHAYALSDPNNLNDTLNISLNYANGSIGSISYFANGDKSLPKERVEIYANGSAAVLDDFKTLSIHANGKTKVTKLLGQNKGQKNGLKLFINTIVDGGNPLIPFNQIYSSTLVTFKILESLRTGQCVNI
jgi:polar amino acid transport system substrate-binding protein